MYGDMRKLWLALGSVVLAVAACSPAGEVSVETVDRDDGRITDAPALAPQAVRAAASRTAEVESARFSITMSITDFPLTGELDFSFDGLMLDGGERVGMLMDLAPLFEQLDQPGELGQFSADGSLTLEYRLIGDYMYMRSPIFGAAGLGDGDRWIRVDLARAAAEAGLSGADLGSMSGTPFGVTSADAFLAFLDAVGADVADLGEAEIRGVRTQGVAATVSLGDLYAMADDEAGADVEAFFEQMDLGGALDVVLPVEAYIDDDGYVRRFVMEMDMAELTDQLAASMDEDFSEIGAAMIGDMQLRLALDLYDFGVEAEIDEPYDFVDLTTEYLAGDF